MGLKSLFKIKNIFILLYILFLASGFVICFHLYLNYVDSEISKKEVMEKVVYARTFEEKNDGFNVLKINDDFKGISNSTYSYKIKNEYFSFIVTTNKSGVSINKFIDSARKINARLFFDDVEKIEYASGDVNNSMLFKITSKTDYKYLAVAGSSYYILGNDIDEIIYENNAFYYRSYNPKYDILRVDHSCNSEIRRKIEDFDYKNYFYKYGKINFLSDYYQKINSKYYYVKDYCNDLKNKQ